MKLHCISFALLCFLHQLPRVLCGQIVSAWRNPFCDIPISAGGCDRFHLNNFSNNIENTLLYVKEGDLSHDSAKRLHYVMSSIGSPSVLLLNINNSEAATINLNWTQLFTGFEPGSVWVSGSSVASALGMVLHKLWLFDDRDDKANIADSTAAVAFELSDLRWQAPVISKNSSAQFTVLFTSAPQNSSEHEPIAWLGNGTVQLQWTVYAEGGRAEDAPHLPHTESMSEWTVSLINVPYSNISHPRFALQILLVSGVDGDSAGADLSVVERTSIDDEYTPGVFRMYHMPLPFDSFLMWKPVAYTDAARSLSTMTYATYGNIQVNVSDVPLSILHAYFTDWNVLTTAAFNITLGYPKDNFYSKSKYLVWTSALGIGALPSESFSTLVATMIFVCFGLPAVAAFGGVSYVGVRKLRRKRGDLDVRDESSYDVSADAST